MTPSRPNVRRFRTPSRAAAARAAIVGLIATLGAAGCGGGDSGTAAPPGDGVAPAAVADLYVRATTATTATLTWTAPGDDGATGVAAQYELRWSTTPLGPDNWSGATVATAPPPGAAGTREVVQVTSLPTGTTCWFGVRTADEGPNWSGLSNVRAATPSAAGGRTWRVTVDGLGDAPTIQAAVDSAQPGDLVLVADGLYTWANQGTAALPTATYAMVTFLEAKHDFTVRSESGPAATILDCQSQGRGFLFQGNLGWTHITLEGFTVRNGRANEEFHYAGGGMIAHVSACTFRDLVFEDCVAIAPSGSSEVGAGGGVWYGGQSAPLFEHCAFRRNRSTIGGGAVLLNSPGETVLRDCEFTANRAEANDIGYGHGAGLYAANFRFTLERCLFASNVCTGPLTRGGGVGVNGSELPAHPMVVRHCTFVDNSAALGGGVNSHEYADLTLESCLVAFSRSGGAFARNPLGALRVGCTDAYGNTGGNGLPSGTVDDGGNFQLDPLFCARGAAPDYHLQSTSPCAPGNHPQGAACGTIGALGVGCGGL